MLISSPTRSNLQALINVSRLSDWPEVDKLLKAELVAITDRLLDASDDVQTRQLQGRARAIRDILDLVHRAPAELAKARPVRV